MSSLSFQSGWNRKADDSNEFHLGEGKALGLGTSLYVPEGLLRIAQQFTAGLSVSIPTDVSPEGTTENGQVAMMTWITSVVPTGLKIQMRPRFPSDKSLGYYQISLREKDVMNFIHSQRCALI